MRTARLLALCLLLLGLALPAAAQQAVILVRHAEKVDQSKDPPLSTAGQERAKRLAALLSRAGVTIVYATQYRRTAETARPLADSLGLEVRTADAADTAGLAKRVTSAKPTDVVLVVGHSNTIPEVLKRLGDAATEEITDSDYGSVFVLVPRPGQAPAVLRLQY